MRVLGEMCITETVYKNLVNCGHCYPQAYMAALGQEEYPLWVLSYFYEKSGVFRIEPEAKHLLDLVMRFQNDLSEETVIDPAASKLFAHANLMELLDENLKREFENLKNNWKGLDFEGFCENEMEIYTLRQLYDTLRFEKDLYSEEQLDILARLQYPLAYDQNRMIGERDLCEISLGEIEKIFPQIYPHITPEPDVWHMPEKAPDSFTIDEYTEDELVDCIGESQGMQMGGM